MSAAARLAAFAAMLVAALGAGAGIGAAVGPDPAEPHHIPVDSKGEACDHADDAHDADGSGDADMEHGSR